MQAVGVAWRQANVAAVYLVHGTFAGSDALGLAMLVGRLFPSATRAIGRFTKSFVDRVLDENGNYTGHYAAQFEEAINAPGERRIAVRRFNWSSENNHVGRADGAVRLIDELAGLGLAPEQRVLLWGHSHAGNVFALVTNLLAGDRESVAKFFEAARPYYRVPWLGWIDIPVWERVRGMLGAGDAPRAAALDRLALDIVTFGTPVRYGWDTAGYRRLLHFVGHRPAAGAAPHRAPFPPTVNDVLRANGGDYVQQIGIAGTNVAPTIFAWRAWQADRKLNGLLQADLPPLELPRRLQAGVRCHDEGTMLLVDYGPQRDSVVKHMAGHAVYTRSEWLLFHAEEVTRRFYATE